MRKRMSYMIQGSGSTSGLFPHMRIGANITLQAKLAAWSEKQIEERLAYLLDMAHLSRHYLKRYPHELSGGENQRVSLCRALMLKPNMLLLDEPFGALDPITRREIQKEFLSIKRELDLTVLLVSHDLQEALRLGDHLVLIDKGDQSRIIESCPKEEFVRSENKLLKEFFSVQQEPSLA